MASNVLKNILRGGMAGATGSLQGRIAALQEEEARREARNNALVKWLTTQSGIGLDTARKGYYERGNRPEPKEEKPLTENQVMGILLQQAMETGDWTAYERAKSAGKTGEERPKNITGIGSYEDVVSGRTATTKKAQEEYDKNEKAIGEKIMSLLGDTNTEDIAGGKPIDVSGNAFIQSLLSAKGRMGQRPEDYQVPMGMEAMSLADSIEMARQNPLIASALMNFEPGGSEYSRKADELVKQGKMTPEEREQYRRETGY